MTSGPVRGLHTVTQNANLNTGELLYIVSAQSIFTLTPGFVLTTLTGPAMEPVNGPVSIIDNGTQLAIFDGSAGYVTTVGSSTYSLISIPFAGPVSATMMDTYGIVNVSGTNQWFQSAVGDLTSWSALEFASADAQPDSIVGVENIHRELWLMKERHTEVWIDAGLPGPGVSFQRLQSTFIEAGLAAPFGKCQVGQSIAWLARDSQGQAWVAVSNGFTPQRVSTHAIEFAIQKYATVADCIAFAYQQEGHVFCVFQFPTGNATWVYDLSTGFWHQRGALLNGQINRWWANCYQFFAGRHVVGDYLTGNLYKLDLDVMTDNGQARKWIRSWRALAKPTDVPIAHRSLRVDMETGIGVPDGTNPQVVLRYSDDGGHVFSNEIQGAAGRTGQTGVRVKYNRLGATRRNSGLDRIYEISSTDPMKIALIGAELELG